MSDKIPYAFIDFLDEGERTTLIIYRQEDGKHDETVGHALALYHSQGIAHSLRYAPEPPPPGPSRRQIEELWESFFDVTTTTLTFVPDREDDGMDPEFVIVAPEVEFDQIHAMVTCLCDFVGIERVLVSVVPNVHNDTTLRVRFLFELEG